MYSEVDAEIENTFYHPICLCLDSYAFALDNHSLLSPLVPADENEAIVLEPTQGLTLDICTGLKVSLYHGSISFHSYCAC